MVLGTKEFPTDKANLFTTEIRDIPTIGFLGGEYGKEIDKAIKRDYARFKVFPKTFIENWTNNQIKMSPSIDGYEDDDGFGTVYVKGRDRCRGVFSKIFYTVAVQDRLPEGVRVATQSDLENALRLEALCLSEVDVATGLILGNEEILCKSNRFMYAGEEEVDLQNFRLRGEIYTDLVNQIKKQKRNIELPSMLPLCGLSLKRDNKSPYGISFKLRDNAEIISIPIITEARKRKLDRGDYFTPEWFYPEDIDLRTGLPSKFISKDDSSRYERKTRKTRIFNTSGNIPKLGTLFLSKGYTIDAGEEGCSESNWRVAIVSPGNEK